MEDNDYNTPESPRWREVHSNRPFIILIIVVLGTIGYSCFLSSYFKSDHESRMGDLNEMMVEAQLGSLRTSQGYYHIHNPSYGTIKQLQNAGYLHRGFDLNNEIENYYLTWDIGQGPEGPEYTIIAYPNSDENRTLRIFAVTEDEIIRVYNPDINDINDVHSWDDASAE